MGDRIAILREGGVLAQYDTPDEILANPADEFVARFVGADRGAEAPVAPTVCATIELLTPRTTPSGRRPRASRRTTVRDALSLMLTSGAHELVVVDDDGTAEAW